MRLILIAVVLCTAAADTVRAQSFSWDNAIIYYAMTDRFLNADPSNDHAYGRGLDAEGNPKHADSPGRFHGGDLRGLITRIEEGYFTELGVNAIWITSPLEQVRGWVGGDNGAFPAYAYHGYWPLDYTRVDSSAGTVSDLRDFVEACHERGIRVLLDVVINHAGYNTLQDMAELGFGAITADGWRDWEPAPGGSWHDYHDRFIDYADSAAWSRWWGAEWIRAGIAGYPPCGDTDQTTCTSSLPDFRTEIDDAVDLPPFLVDKWSAENAADSTSYPAGGTASVRDHIAVWLARWVRELGIDGFRLDTAKNLDGPTILRLKKAGTAALRQWKEAHPDQALDELDFWMVGEVFGHGVERSEYFDYGLDAVLNFAFQHDLEKGADLDSLYTVYAALTGPDPGFNIVSYVSSHDTRLFDRERLFEAGTALMLAPGNVQIFYGDETGRPPSELQGPEATRSPMDWENVDEALLTHWKRLGRFRARHPAVAMGSHEKLGSDPYAFSRSWSRGREDDRVVIVLGATGKTTVNVSRVFPDNTILRDAYTGSTSFVSYGLAVVQVGDAGVALLEEVK